MVATAGDAPPISISAIDRVETRRDSSGELRRFDREAIRFTGIDRPVRDYEAVLEVTYRARISPWWILQPDLQLIAHPGGHTAPAFPGSPARPIPNALILGLRSSIAF